MENKVVSLFNWEVYEYFWGAAVREQRTGKWDKVFLKPDSIELDLKDLIVDIHENGIEFLR